ncbi:MAG: NAD(P)-dependent alcohol dehydrogenase [Alphaproteobacteria bacterium]|nr:NAD(P)-dependent alcohol dehydrogenase [Alphaproteobacteria bacterium]
MKAIVCTRYGSPDVLEIRDLPEPVPGPDEVLIRVRATTVSSADWRIRSLSLPRGFGLLGRVALGFARPRRRILGTELAGDVAAVGARVTRFRPGDAVFAFAGGRLGCHVEYRCFPAGGAIAHKPPGLSYEQASAVSFGGATMLDFFRRASLQAGERVLVNGATGTVGSAAVQLARLAGARVTAVCSGDSAALVQSLGATRVVDRAREDFVRGGDLYDVIVDTAGTAPFSRCAGVLAPGGRLLLVLATLPEILRAPWNRLRSGRRVIAGPAAERPAYIETLRGLAQAGSFVPLVDSIHDFDAFRAAHARVDGGRKRGSVVLRVAGEAAAPGRPA